MDDSGIKRIHKSNTSNIQINYKNYMIKTMTHEDAQQEMYNWLSLKDYIPTPHHEVHKTQFCSLLIRGPVTDLSIGDLVYEHFSNNNRNIPDKGDAIQSANFKRIIKTKFENTFKNLNTLVAYCLKTDLLLPITLDNIDCDGLVYDFGDFGTGFHHVLIAMSDFLRYYSLSASPVPDFVKTWFPQNFNFSEMTWLDKVLQINNNLLYAQNVVTELFINPETNFTDVYSNQVTGTHVINTTFIENCSTFTQNLYHLQDPALRWRQPVLNITEVTSEYSTGPQYAEKAREIFYNEEAYLHFAEHLGDIDGVFNYTYYQGDESDVVNDVYLYDYQGRLFLQPHILKFLYKRTLQDFACCATDQRYSLLDCIPRKSSLGPGSDCMALRSVKQKDLYEAAPDNFIEELVDLSARSPLIFTTKVTQKFAITSKPRARTVAGCGMFSSTLFRALHKPVTANFVAQAQLDNPTTHHLIGVSKFHLGFDKYFKSKYGDISDYQIFGSDYTKCDRSFPLVLRCAVAACLYELGHWDPYNHHFTNEVHAVMLDFLEYNNALYSKPGGTSSGDATTAFGNTLYNHMVHLLIQLQTLVTSKVDPLHSALKGAAVKGWQTGDFSNYNSLLDIYNSQSYHFNFLSDDSFILTNKDPTLPQIFNRRNFSAKLETIIHTKVDENKAWESSGYLHEFCSSEIRDIDGHLQYIPSFDRLIATLIIHSDFHSDELNIIRAAAICAEGAIYGEVDRPKWDALFGFLEKLLFSFVIKYGYYPLPTEMLSESFYFRLVRREGEEEDLLMSTITSYGIQLQKSTYTQCIACSNPTVSKCQSCPVPYPLCNYCAYTHYIQTKHLVTHLPTCSHVGCVEFRPEHMCYSLFDGHFSTKCINHAGPFQVPITDSTAECFKLPLSQQCCRQESSVSALNTTEENWYDHNFFYWDVNKSTDYNNLVLLHDSYLLAHYSDLQTTTHNYTVIDPENNILFIPDAHFGPTTYATIYDNKNAPKLICTLDPVGGDNYRATFIDNTKRFNNYSSIARNNHNIKIYRPSDLDCLSRVQFILGPPGTGKTTYIVNNYFSTASQHHRVVYGAPTHKLIHDMDITLKDNQDVTIIKAKLNNREYIHPVDDVLKSIHLGTIYVLRPVAGCTLLIDEASLLTPLDIAAAINITKCREVIVVGDPFQLAPITPNRAFCWSYDTFYLKHRAASLTTLNTCFRCPSNIWKVFAGAYLKHDIPFQYHQEGGEVHYETILTYSPNISDAILKRAHDLAKPDGIILCNYREGVTRGTTLGLPIQTIDSAQGLTVPNVVVLIFGTTNFSKVTNRLIVATSRATQKLTIFAHNDILEHIKNELSVKPTTLQSLTYEGSLTEITIGELAKHTSASGICDIEFFHTRHQGNKNFLGCGEVNILTCRSFTTYLRPKYNRDGIFIDVADCDIFVSKLWRYMMKHLPDQHTSRINLNSLLHFINDTCDLTDSPFIFIFFNGHNDVESVAQFTTSDYNLCEPCFREGTTRPARFAGIYNQDQMCGVCQECAYYTELHYLVKPRYFNFESDINLTATHSLFCVKYHGEAHKAASDVMMTSCIIGHHLKPLLPIQEYKITSESFPKVEFLKVCSSRYSKHDRLYGSLHVTHNTIIPYTHKPITSHVPPPNHTHTSDYILITNFRRPHKSCHPYSSIYYCTNCQNHYVRWNEEVFNMAQDGYEYLPTIQLHLSQYEKQLKLSAEIIQTPAGLKVILGKSSDSTGVMYDFYGSLDHTILKAANENSAALPSTEVFYGLGITCTIGCASHFIDCKTFSSLDPWDIPLIHKAQPTNSTCYILERGRPNIKSTASFTVGLRNQIFLNTTGVEIYHLRKFEDGKEVELPDSLFSTGRLHNVSLHQFPGEDVITNCHIQLGDYHINSSSIGGAHLFPGAFTDKDNQVNLLQMGFTPLWYGTIVQNKNIKTNSSICDVHSGDFMAKLDELINSSTISLKTKITIDYQQIPIMIWAEKGKIATAYLQSGGPDNTVSIENKRNLYYHLYTPSPSKQLYDYDYMPVFYLPKFLLKQCTNLSKFQQLCIYIQHNVSLLHSPRVLSVGAATSWHEKEVDNSTNYHGIPVGGIIFTRFFNNKVEHYDIRPINSCNNYFQVVQKPEGKYNLIISDIWKEGDNTNTLVEYINSHLALGGTIIFKTTKRSFITSIASIASNFGGLDFVNLRANVNSSEIFVVFKYKKQMITQLKPDAFDIIQNIHFHRQTQLNVPIDTEVQLDIFKPKTGYKVPPMMMSKIQPFHWSTGKFAQEC